VERIDVLTSLQGEGVAPTEERSTLINSAVVPSQKDATPVYLLHLIGEPSLSRGGFSKGEDCLACHLTYLLCIPFEEKDLPSPSGRIAATHSTFGAEEPNPPRIFQDQISLQPASDIVFQSVSP